MPSLTDKIRQYRAWLVAALAAVAAYATWALDLLGGVPPTP